MIDINNINKAFDEYVSHYDMNDEKISLKYFHTYRVCQQSLNICKSLGLGEEDTLLAYLIAILHDIGRFEQHKRFGTYNDAKSMDHASFGCTLLFENLLIRKFISDRRYDEIIRNAIFNHNKYSIPKDLDERSKLHAMIIRDADKIDIVHNIVNVGGITLDDDSGRISPLVLEDFNRERSIHLAHRKTKNDIVMCKLAFGFDLNFEYTYMYFRDNEFINKMYEMIENKEIFEVYVNRVNEHIERKCNNVRDKVLS